MLVDQADDGDGRVEQPGRQVCHAVEFWFGRSVQQLERIQGIQAA